MSPARTDVTTQITERVLIDRPVEVVWKLACDVVGALQAIPNVRLGEHSPLGDRASFDAIISRPPYRVHLQATAAMIESDAMERTVRIAIVGRDRSGRGQLHATLAIRVSEFGAGAQLITDLEIRCAGALVRAIGDAAFDGLQTVLHEWIVACTGDAFASLPEAPSLWDDFEVESVPESATSVFDSQAGKLVACESVASVSLASASVSGASVSGASVSGASVSGASVSGAPVSGAPALPVESIPRARGMRSWSRRSSARTFGTVAATAAVVAAAAGAYAVRRLLGRR